MKAGLTPDGKWSLEGVLAHDVPAAWAHVWPLLAPSLEMLPEDKRPTQREIAEGLCRGSRQLWIAWNTGRNRCECALITEVLRWPDLTDGKVCFVWCAGGRGIKQFAGHGLALLLAWARAQDCAILAHGGRPGWQRLAGTTPVGKSGRWHIYGRPTAVH